MMQNHLHQLQQQLSSLLSSALPSPSPSTDSSRIAALESLRLSLLYPPNSTLLPPSALFLSQHLFQLLSDKSYGVSQAAAISYGSLCAVLASSNPLPIHLHVLIERFLAWTLPFRTNSAELALSAIGEFLAAGDAASVEIYAASVLKACQEVLEDERTSPALLPQLLGVLCLISVKFARCFRARFVDLVDLLIPKFPP